jgi:hypothetical protein
LDDKNTLQELKKKIINLEYYASKFLQIKDKSGNKCNLHFNKAQKYLHDKLEAQKKRLGYIRVLIVKGRQQGCSTYIAARFFHEAITEFGKSIFILSHDSQTTRKLFDHVKFFYENLKNSLPEYMIPVEKTSNKNELKFKGLDSSYNVGTAGNVEVGRGFTVQCLHLSEAAFYENPEEIESGLVQAVPDVEGTSIIYETTANGMNSFYEKIMTELETTTSDFEVIFIPWFWQDEYKRTVPEDFKITAEEEELQKLYNLSMEQIVWRRFKIVQFKGDDTRFKRDYPCNLQEAFQGNTKSLISVENVMKARKNNLQDEVGPLVMGVDAARDGDRTVFVYRRGREMLPFDVFENMKETRLADLIANKIKDYGISRVFIDVQSAYGAIDILHGIGYKDIVEGVHFNQKPIRDHLFSNKRAEILMAVKEWLDHEVNIPDSNELQADLLCVPFPETTALNKIQFISKKEIKKKLKKSPDIFDALALTFTRPVASAEILRIAAAQRQRNEFRKNKRVLTTMNRIQKKRRG